MKRNSSDSIRLPRTDLKTLLEEKGNVVITTCIARCSDIRLKYQEAMLLVALKSASFRDNGVKSAKTDNKKEN